MAVGAGAVWAMSDAGQTLSRIDPERNAVVAKIKVSPPEAVAAGDGAVWLTYPFDNTVYRIDPATNKVVATIHVGPRPEGIAVSPGAVWVATADGPSLSQDRSRDQSSRGDDPTWIEARVLCGAHERGGVTRRGLGGAHEREQDRPRRSGDEPRGRDGAARLRALRIPRHRRDRCLVDQRLRWRRGHPRRRSDEEGHGEARGSASGRPRIRVRLRLGRGNRHGKHRSHRPRYGQARGTASRQRARRSPRCRLRLDLGQRRLRPHPAHRSDPRSENDSGITLNRGRSQGQPRRAE